MDSNNDTRPFRPKKQQTRRPPERTGRLVPRAVDIEAAVLGALMLEKDAFAVVCDLLKPESFYEPRHMLVYQAIQTL